MVAVRVQPQTDPLRYAERALPGSASQFGLRRLSDAPEYKVWQGMMSRCRYDSNYAGRGIKVCLRWRSFVNFYRDMGPRPSDKHSIDRIDNDGNYQPSNCRWATWDVQGNNKQRKLLIEFRGESLHPAAWQRRTGVCAGTLAYRFSKGLAPDLCFSATPGPLLGRFFKREWKFSGWPGARYPAQMGLSLM